MSAKWIKSTAITAASMLSSFAFAQSAPKPPNVLFVICDDLNLSEGCYGNTVVHTPNIDRLAEHGVRFQRAYCNWPLCLPSRNSFLSGRRPDERFTTGDLLRQHVPDVEFLPEHFRKAGYFTARVGKLFHTRSVFNPDYPKNLEDPLCWDVSDNAYTKQDPCGYSVVYSSVPKGLAANPELQEIVVFHDLLNKAGNPAYDYWMERAALKLDDSETVDGNIASHVSLLLEENANRKHPFFIAAGFRRPHLLWTAPKKYFDLYDPKQIQLPVEPEGHEKLVPPVAFTRGAPDMTDEQRKMAIQSYYACVSSVDHQVGVLLDEMDKLKLWDNTIVLFTSDHGWHLDQHGLWGKVSLFQESAKVPLIIAAPGIKPGVCPRTVEMVDFYPTLTQLAGLTTPANLDGASLVPQLQQPDSMRNRPAFSVVRHGKTWGKAINTEDWRYTEWGDAANKGAELYDLRSDPKEYHNLAQDPKFADVRSKLKAVLDPITGKLRDAETAGPASD